MIRRITHLVLLLLPLLLAEAYASEISGYLPLNLAPTLEHDVEQLLVLADQPIVRRPIALNTIIKAMPAACEADEALCLQVQRELAPWLGRAALGMASFEAAIAKAASVSTPNPITQPNQRGAPEDAKWKLSGAAYAQLGGHLRVNVGGVAYKGRANPAGTYVSVGISRAQLDVGFRDRWWSPMRDSSMLISTEAPTLPSVTLSNSKPLTRVRLSYEVFMARLSLSDRIFYQGARVAGYPRVAGFHVSLEPVKGLTFSANRLMQFGGGGRQQSITALFKAFFNAYAYDNTNPGAATGADLEFGNQQLSFSSQLTIPGRMPAAVYVEYAAEDTFHAENYRFGNGALSFGLFLPKFRPNLQARYEFSNWEDVWYVHHLYGDGLTNHGRVLGNWAADWRAPHDFAGGQSHMLQVNWRRDNGAAIELRYRTAKNASYTGKNYQQAHMLSAAIAGPWRQFEIGAKVDAGLDMYGKAYGRIAATLTVTGDARNSIPSMYATGRGTSTPTSDVTVERFVEVGVMAGKLRYEQDFEVVPARNSSEAGAHVGIGVRRSVSKHSDFGARLEIDDLRGRTLLSLRALDYRYRFNGKLAVSGFFGFSRYAGPTPAHGYYLGTGAQWRNIRPGWDLNADLRYADRIVRKKIIPGESIRVWPNEFWSMTGGAVYLSRRF